MWTLTAIQQREFHLLEDFRDTDPFINRLFLGETTGSITKITVSQLGGNVGELTDRLLSGQIHDMEKLRGQARLTAILAINLWVISGPDS